jgi:ribonuclease-3
MTRVKTQHLRQSIRTYVHVCPAILNAITNILQYGSERNESHRSNGSANSNKQPILNDCPFICSQLSSHPPPEADQNDPVANLLSALDTVLKSTPKNKLYKGLSSDTLAKCQALQASLAQNVATPKIASQSNFNPIPYPQRRTNLETLHPHSVTPWDSSSIPQTYPPLPQIYDTEMEKKIFTHKGVVDGNPDKCYERFEFIGDTYLELINTLLISNTFQKHLPGQMSQLRERCVKNDTLAGYSEHYGFGDRLHLGKDLRERFAAPRHKLSDSEYHEKRKVLGDVFESYIAGIVLSDPEHGIERVAAWLKDLSGMTLRKDIIAEEQQSKKSKAGQIIAEPKVALSAQIVTKGVKLIYKDYGESVNPDNGLPLYTIGCYFNGFGEVDRLIGTGTAPSKKEAGNKAAEATLRNKEAIKELRNKKLAFDEQRKAEKAAA